MGQLASETQPKDLCFRAVGCREAVGVQELFESVLSLSSSVGVMQVEDTRRVTQVTLVIVDD